MFAAPTLINVYTINLDQDSTPLELVLLHHLPILQTTNLLSVPFIGSHCTYFVGIYDGTFRRIIIKHDNHSPPVVEELGNLEHLTLISSDVIFGPSASIVRSQSRKSLEIVIYEFGADRTSFRRKNYNAPDDQSLPARYLAGFDDLVGRIVLRSEPGRDQLMVLDLI